MEMWLLGLKHEDECNQEPYRTQFNLCTLMIILIKIFLFSDTITVILEYMKTSEVNDIHHRTHALMKTEKNKQKIPILILEW